MEDSIYKQKAAEKSLKPSSRSIKFKIYSIFLFVNSRSVKSVRGGKKKNSCRPFRKVKKQFKK